MGENYCLWFQVYSLKVSCVYTFLNDTKWNGLWKLEIDEWGFYNNHLHLLISSCSCSLHFLSDRGIFNEEKGIRKGGQRNQNTERKILLSSVTVLSSLKCLKSNIFLLLNLINSYLVLIKSSFLSTLKAVGKIHRSLYYHSKQILFFS